MNRRNRLFNTRNFIALIIILILMMAAYGFAATNTVGASSAGDGSGTVSGYTVSAVTYTLDATTPTDIDGVSFTLTGASAPTTVYIELNSVAGTWFSCSMAGTTATCDTTGSAVPIGATLTALRVVAAQ